MQLRIAYCVLRYGYLRIAIGRTAVDGVAYCVLAIARKCTCQVDSIDSYCTTSCTRHITDLKVQCIKYEREREMINRHSNIRIRNIANSNIPIRV